MAVTIGELNRATLVRQLLVERASFDVPAAVHRLVAIQAQQPASPYLALWNRVADFDPADLDRAFVEGEVVKASLLRVTLHAVHADDHGPFRVALEPTFRTARFGPRQLALTGLTADELDALVGEAPAFAAEPRTNAEAEAWVASTVPNGPAKAVWRAVRRYAPIRHVPTGGPWSFGRRPTHVAAAFGVVDPDDRAAQAAALQALVRRYLEVYGPASLPDVAQFLMVSKPLARAALDALADELVVVDRPDGRPLHDLPGAPRPPSDLPVPPRLLGMWDNVLLAHADRSRIVPPEHKVLVTRRNGDVLPTLLVDGRVAGVWRTVADGVEATAFDKLTKAAWSGLAEEAAGLLELLADREPHPYQRYDHWWTDLPGVEVRVVGR
jgi:hypothetical protein